MRENEKSYRIKGLSALLDGWIAVGEPIPGHTALSVTRLVNINTMFGDSLLGIPVDGLFISFTKLEEVSLDDTDTVGFAHDNPHGKFIESKVLQLKHGPCTDEVEVNMLRFEKRLQVIIASPGCITNSYYSDVSLDPLSCMRDIVEECNSLENNLDGDLGDVYFIIPRILKAKLQ